MNPRNREVATYSLMQLLDKRRHDYLHNRGNLDITVSLLSGPTSKDVQSVTEIHHDYRHPGRCAEHRTIICLRNQLDSYKHLNICSQGAVGCPYFSTVCKIGCEG